MEVTVQDVRGIEGEAILSIRAGTARRQAPLSPGQPLQFPSLPLNANPLKIDLLRQIGSCKLALRSSQGGGPAAEVYSVLFPAEVGGTGVSMDVQVQEMPHLCGPGGGLFANNLPQPVGGETANGGASGPGGDGGPGSGGGGAGGAAGDPGAGAEKKVAVAEEARAYLKRFGLLGFLQELLQYIIRERPEDPFVFMAAYLMRVTGYKDPNAAAAAAASMEANGISARAVSPTLGKSPEEAAMTALQRQNARLDAENERIREEIAKFQRFCDQTLTPSQTPLPPPEQMAEECVAMVGPAAAALEGALRSRRSELAAEGQPLEQHEELSRAVSTFCQGFSDLASRLAAAVSRPAQGLDLTTGGAQEAELAAAATNARLEAENEELNRQIQEGATNLKES